MNISNKTYTITEFNSFSRDNDLPNYQSLPKTTFDALENFLLSQDVEAETNINELNTQSTRAENNINELDARNETAVNNKNALDESIQRGEDTKRALDESIDTANAIKPPLDEANELAEKNIEQIKNLDTTNIIQDVADVKKEIGDARGTFSTLDERITEAEASGGFMISETLPDVTDRKPVVLYMQILQSQYEQNKLRCIYIIYEKIYTSVKGEIYI